MDWQNNYRTDHELGTEFLDYLWSSFSVRHYDNGPSIVYEGDDYDFILFPNGDPEFPGKLDDLDVKMPETTWTSFMPSQRFTEHHFSEDYGFNPQKEWILAKQKRPQSPRELIRETSKQMASETGTLARDLAGKKYSLNLSPANLGLEGHHLLYLDNFSAGNLKEHETENAALRATAEYIEDGTHQYSSEYTDDMSFLRVAEELKETARE